MIFFYLFQTVIPFYYSAVVPSHTNLQQNLIELSKLFQKCYQFKRFPLYEFVVNYNVYIVKRSSVLSAYMCTYIRPLIGLWDIWINKSAIVIMVTPFSFFQVFRTMVPVDTWTRSWEPWRRGYGCVRWIGSVPWTSSTRACVSPSVATTYTPPVTWTKPWRHPTGFY